MPGESNCVVCGAVVIWSPTNIIKRDGTRLELPHNQDGRRHSETCKKPGEKPYRYWCRKCGGVLSGCGMAGHGCIMCKYTPGFCAACYAHPVAVVCSRLSPKEIDSTTKLI